ncbi:translation initiation factor eIF 4e-like domain-containing protein [Mrakia frigida]|uniref:eukaryotic translation initiation factor 4E n=1 Tax=Mrakia frigida TaxID=29902 RepID=UPI003FCC26C8
MGSKAPERWKAVPTLSEIRERHMAATAAASTGKGADVEAVAVGDEHKDAGGEEGEKKVDASGGGLQKRKGPLADLLTRKEVVLDEMMKPPPTPVPEFRVVKEEHPLANTWTMTYSPPIIPSASTLSNLSLDDSASATVATPSVSSVYTSSLLHLGHFNTIESWARLSNHLSTVPPSMLSKGGNYQLFKKGVEPIFEDPANEKGGKWVLTMRGHRASTLDDAWRETILCLVGEALESGSSEDEEDEICGAVVSVRAKADRIQLWIKSKDPVNLVNGIGKRFVKALGLDKEGGRPAEEGSFSLEFQYNQGSAPPISKYITLSSSTSASLARPGVKGAWRTNSSSAVPSLVVVGEGVGA